MTELESHNRPFHACTVFFRRLFELGVRHAVISPGSRSTPLTLAAATHPLIEKHVILDERSAAFTALGIGKATGLPAVLICTSGTAAANYYPAVIEAFQTGVPLLLATADRPASLRNTNANQTIDQVKLYGKFALSFENLNIAENFKNTIKKLNEITSGAFWETVNFKGPVHLNFPFRKPLEPDSGYVASLRRENEGIRPKEPELPAPNVGIQPAEYNSEIRIVLKRCEKPLLIIGPLPADSRLEPIFELADILKAPVLSEQGKQDHPHSIQGFEGFLRSNKIRNKLKPDVILRFGLQPASKSLLQALDQWKPVPHFYIKHRANKKDSSFPVSGNMEWDGHSLPAEHFTGKANRWLNTWKASGKSYMEFKDTIFENFGALTDGHVYEELSGQIPGSWWIFFSNSFPARDRSMFGNWNNQQIYLNRGASGIDGITSTATGINIGTNRPGVLFTGDLAFLHDTNALLNHRLLKKPLVTVVINNKGGSIFRMLPIAEHREYFTSYFETPQQVSLSQLCKSYNIDYKKIDTAGKLKNFDLQNFSRNNGSRLHVLECQTDPEASMQLREKLWSSK